MVATDIPDAAAEGPRQRLLRWLWLLAAAPLVPTLGLGFFNDDFVGLARLSALGWAGVLDQFRPTDFEFLRPLTFAFFRLEMTAFGLEASLFHATHLVLFVLAAWMTGRLGRRLGGPRAAGWAAALALLYPGRFETVAWIASLFDLLALLAVTATLLLVLSPRCDRRRGHLWMVAAACFLAPLTKESAYVLPIVIVAWEAIGITPGDSRRRAARALAATAGAAASLALRALALGGVGGYAGTSAAAGVRSLIGLPELLVRALLLPVNPSFGRTSTAIGIACGLSAAVVLLRGLWGREPSSTRPMLAALSLTVAGPLPALLYIDPATATWAHNRNLTLLGLGIALVVALLLQSSARGTTLVGCAVAVSWCAATALNLAAWHDSARARDAILAGIELATRDGAPAAVWVDGPIQGRRGAQLLGGRLAEAVAVTWPDRPVTVESAFLQQLTGRPVGPPAPTRGVRSLTFRFDPDLPALMPLP